MPDRCVACLVGRRRREEEEEGDEGKGGGGGGVGFIQCNSRERGDAQGGVCGDDGDERVLVLVFACDT